MRRRSAVEVVLSAEEIAGVCCPECCRSRRKCRKEYNRYSVNLGVKSTLYCKYLLQAVRDQYWPRRMWV